ncbi:hypothetical protein BK816_02550 [Boudabousia tangfeifanii]|uniref:Polymerase/histidinol phosphatase N-terminal domain-containing protein n=1 Tax=Boudabousia tangfeifanii TaxID=1912795 RepID=A0A1D9MJD2_9ACTO|nr:PHP domain-containing protein [Boudabousia tangfeifanii]AOZ72318.1 hypothetical protein BK816_02550 [Boudabousia tangfeifanii]
MPAQKIDLHTHSSYSDGTDTIEEMLQKAQDAGLTKMALTDHDTYEGWQEFSALGPKYGIDVLCGTEVSTKLDGHSVHMLAYGYQPGGELDAIFARACDSRRTRGQRMVEKLSVDYPITWEDVIAQTAGETTTIGRPHIADALVATGKFADRKAAFNGPLSPQSPYYASYWAPTPVDAIKAINASGGLAVIAHAFSITRRTSPSDEDIAAMVEAGLAGMERDHRDHLPEQRAHVDRLAKECGLFVTGSSDYHGLGKPNLLGENTTSIEVWEEICSRVSVITLK